MSMAPLGQANCPVPADMQQLVARLTVAISNCLFPKRGPYTWALSSLSSSWETIPGGG